VVKTKPSALSLRLSPALITGLSCLLLLGCQATTPEEVTLQFWQELAQGHVEDAKSKVTQDTQAIVNTREIDQHSPINIGEAVVEDNNAYVTTTINRNNKPVTFETILMKEDDNGWKVDFQQTHTSIAMAPFEGIAKSLQEMGETFTNQLEQQLPLIEKEIEAFGNELKGEIDRFGQTLKKPKPPASPNSRVIPQKQTGAI